MHPWNDSHDGQEVLGYEAYLNDTVRPLPLLLAFFGLKRTDFIFSQGVTCTLSYDRINSHLQPRREALRKKPLSSTASGLVLRPKGENSLGSSRFSSPTRFPWCILFLCLQ